MGIRNVGSARHQEGLTRICGGPMGPRGPALRLWGGPWVPMGPPWDPNGTHTRTPMAPSWDPNGTPPGIPMAPPWGPRKEYKITFKIPLNY